MNCPKCKGLLSNPYWDYNTEGKTYQIKCLNCGFVLFHPSKIVYWGVKNRWQKEICRHQIVVAVGHGRQT